nr:hypothetical protein [Tanacetum cinerariifolium]
MHNNIMAAGLRDRSPMLATGRYAQWQSRFLRYIDKNEIYSIVDACKTAHEMWLAIERLYKGESLNIQDVKTNLFWKFGKFTSHDGESMELYYSRFYKTMNEMIRNNLIYQKEVNEIHAERIAKPTNPLALVATAQQFPYPYYQAPKLHRSFAPTSKQLSSTRFNATTKYKDKDMQKNLALIAKYFKKIYKPPNNNLRTSSNSRNKNVDTSSMYKNDNQSGQFRNQRKITVDGARETVGSQIDEQELEAHYSYMAKIQEVPITDLGTDTEPLEQVQYDAEYNVLANERHHFEQPESINNTCVVKKVDSDVIPNSTDMCNNDIQTDQNAKECDDERVVLANLIANLTLDTEENKNILKQLKKANASLTQELKECKSNLEESNTTRDSFLIALQSKQTELETYKTLIDHIVDYDKLERKLNETLLLLSQKEIDIKEGLKLKAYEILVVKEKHDETPLKSIQMKDKVVPNNSQVKFKKTEVEEEHMLSSISNKTKSLTACNDSLKSRTSNVNVVCATCGKFVFNSNHDACVSKFIHDENARTKKHKVVPISTRQPKSQANKSIATPPKKTVASESTI